MTDHGRDHGMKIPHDKRVRVTRTIVMEGPGEWLDNTLRFAAVRPDGCRFDLGDGRTARETACKVEVLP